MQTTRPRIRMKVLPMSGCHFENIRSKLENLDYTNCFIRTKTSTSRKHIYYLATDNIHIVLENDNTVLIKGLKVVNVKFSKTHIL